MLVASVSEGSVSIPGALLVRRAGWLAQQKAVNQAQSRHQHFYWSLPFLFFLKLISSA